MDILPSKQAASTVVSVFAMIEGYEVNKKLYLDSHSKICLHSPYKYRPQVKTAPVILEEIMLTRQASRGLAQTVGRKSAYKPTAQHHPGCGKGATSAAAAQHRKDSLNQSEPPVGV